MTPETFSSLPLWQAMTAKHGWAMDDLAFLFAATTALHADLEGPLHHRGHKVRGERIDAWRGALLSRFGVHPFIIARHAQASACPDLFEAVQKSPEDVVAHDVLHVATIVSSLIG